MYESSSHRYADQLFVRLKEWTDCSAHLKAHHRSPARAAQYAHVTEELETFLPPGITQLYMHQQRACLLALEGKAVTVATTTASGKTYAMALASRVRRHLKQGATLLCVAPTRALIEQWVERLSAWDKNVVVASYTGDTPQSARPEIRKTAQVVVTTPDMLHVALLPYHRGWARFFAGLQDIIIDESHIYSGVFGTHFALITRRLRRVVALHGADPTFLLGSATIGNPAEHAAQLTGLDVEAITESGAPSGGRLTLLWQPPDERTYTEEAAGLFAFFVSQGTRTILFGQARQSVEKMLRQARALLPSSLSHKIQAYRAGYTKEQRRDLESRIARGDILGVLSTSALEIGIDVGDLDVSIIAGFPGSISSYFQQAGRAGRRNRSALSILVLREDALDQYFSSHPAMLLDSTPEKALVNTANPYILPGHLLCAAYEHPLSQADFALFGEATARTVGELVEQQRLECVRGRYYPHDRSKSAAFGISLRQAGERFVILSGGSKLEDTDVHHAMLECHPHAIYFSQGASYQVQQLKLEEGVVEVVPREVAYYTEPLVETDVEILSSHQKSRRPLLDLCTGTVVVTRTVHGYVKRHQTYRSVLDKEDLPSPLSLPLETRALWMMVAEEVMARLSENHLDGAGALHAVEHAMIALLPLYVLGDRRDVGGVSVVPHHPQTQSATIFIYDGYPGGMGYADEAFRQFDALAQATLEALKACPCTGGCYKCIFSPKCGNQNRPLDKTGAIFVLELLLKKQPAARRQRR